MAHSLTRPAGATQTPLDPDKQRIAPCSAAAMFPAWASARNRQDQVTKLGALLAAAISCITRRALQKGLKEVFLGGFQSIGVAGLRLRGRD